MKWNSMARTALIIGLVLITIVPSITVVHGDSGRASNGPSLNVPRFYPDKNPTTRASTITINGTTNGTAVTINGDPATLGGGKFTAQVDLFEGPNLIHIVASDAGGNTTIRDYVITRDTIPPVVAITNPSFPLQTNKRSLHVDGIVEEWVVTSNVEINGKDVNVTADTFSADVELNRNITSIIVKARDIAGNERTVIYPVTFDDQLNLTFSTRFEHDYYFNYTKSKELIETYYDRIFIDGKTDPGASIIINGNPVKVLDNGSFTEMVELKMGSMNISIVAKDAAGNNVSDFINVKRYKYEPFLVPVESAGMLLILGLIAGSVGGWFVGRHKERKVQAAAKQKAAEEAYQARKKVQAQNPVAPPKETKPKEPPAKKETKN